MTIGHFLICKPPSFVMGQELGALRSIIPYNEPYNQAFLRMDIKLNLLECPEHKLTLSWKLYWQSLVIYYLVISSFCIKWRILTEEFTICNGIMCSILRPCGGKTSWLWSTIELLWYNSSTLLQCPIVNKLYIFYLDVLLFNLRVKMMLVKTIIPFTLMSKTKSSPWNNFKTIFDVHDALQMSTLSRPYLRECTR